MGLPTAAGYIVPVLLFWASCLSSKQSKFFPFLSFSFFYLLVLIVSVTVPVVGMARIKLAFSSPLDEQGAGAGAVYRLVWVFGVSVGEEAVVRWKGRWCVGVGTGGG